MRIFDLFKRSYDKVSLSDDFIWYGFERWFNWEEKDTQLNDIVVPQSDTSLYIYIYNISFAYRRARKSARASLDNATRWCETESCNHFVVFHSSKWLMYGTNESRPIILFYNKSTLHLTRSVSILWDINHSRSRFFRSTSRW